MSVSGPGRVIDNGLVLYLDASNNKSYVSGNATWFDVSRNNNSGSLVNGPTFNSSNGGSIVFDGANDYVLTNYTQPAYTTTSNFTWNIWVWPNGGNVYAPLVGDRGSDTDFIKLTPLRMEYYPMVFGPSLTNNVWSNACVVKSGTNFFYYLNGNLAATATSNATHNTNPFYVGGDPTGNEYSNSRIAQVLVYNRALSADEILANYNLEKKRFGL